MKARNSLDLSEFFNDDDSEGHRLVEFIRKRRGGLKNQNGLFLNYEPQRFSLNVQLEKIPSPLKDLCDDTNKNNTKKGYDKKDELQAQSPAALASGHMSHILPATASPPHPPGENLSPKLQNVSSTACPFQQHTELKSLPDIQVSSRFSSTRKSGVGPSDSLRRYSLKKRLRNICGGRRTLLQEFENTIGTENFDPPICSTPNPQTHLAKQLPHLNSISKTNGPTSSEKCCDIKSSCCTHTDTLLQSLQRKDDELKLYMKNILNNTTKDKQGSPTNETKKRTYIVEKGNISGQIILAIDKESALSPRKLLEERAEKQNHPNQCDVAETSKGSCTLSKEREEQEKVSPNPQIIQFEEDNTFHERNDYIAPSPQELQITETQDVPHNRTNSVLIQSDPKMPLIVIPINQNLNINCSESLNRSNIVAETNLTKTTLTTRPIQQPSAADDDHRYQVEEDCLKLADIITDDEDEAPKNLSVENNIQLPLNLAKHGNNSPVKRIRKMSSSRRRLANENFDSDSEPPTKTYKSRRITKRPRMPLNKAPGIPLNGETFAQELALMSNCEILDLRKRNSVGQVFPISGRRSLRNQEEAVKKQQELGSQIEKELIKRHLDNVIVDDAANVGADVFFYNNFPVPDEFRDSLCTQKDIDNNSSDANIINENSLNRISFKNKEKKVCPRRTKGSSLREVPEVLKQYLNISKVLSQKKNIKSIKSKRSLYTKDQFETNETENAIVPSPPKTNGALITAVKVVSPPPQLSLTIQKSLAQNYETTNEDVTRILTATPPKGFETDYGTNTNNNKQLNTNGTHESLQDNFQISANINTNSNVNDNHLFKIPGRPAPRRYGRKQKDKTPTNKVLESSTNCKKSDNDDSIDRALRRSKRVHVPLKRPTVIQLLYEQLMTKRLKYFENQNRKEKEKQKYNKNKVFANNKESERNLNKTELPTVSEKSISNEKILNKLKKEKKTKTKISKTRKQKTKNYNDEITTAKENVECSGLTVNTTLPGTMNTPALKVKPFKVRVARVKFPLQASNKCSDSISSTTNISQNSNCELISWLKNIGGTKFLESGNAAVWEEMRISAACDITFTQLQGVEYAFYDTNEKACLGYLRFKPHQKKPRKRAKRYHLHFISIAGNFRITANDNTRQIGVGDMVAIEKSVYYDIENITEDFGVLMVIKK